MTKWIFLILASSGITLAQTITATSTVQCVLYSCDEWNALSKSLITGMLALIAHYLDWRKRSVQHRKNLAVLQNGLFWSALVGGMAGAVTPILTKSLNLDIGGFSLWLQLVIAAGLGISAGSIAAALKLGISSSFKGALSQVTEETKSESRGDEDA
jgi:hypothetical protein